jgi:excisionase family DNA binding protein
MSTSPRLEQDHPAQGHLLAEGLVSIREAARFLGVGKTSIYKAMNAGTLVWVKIGKRRVIPKAALVAFAARNLRGGWAS